VEHPSKILNQLNIHALKKFGQNFLVNTDSLKNVETIFDKNKTILEIGPGTGSVTEYLLSRNFSLVLSEIDNTLVRYLDSCLGSRVEIIHGDFLEIDMEAIKRKGVTQIIGNLPFYITTPIIEKVMKEMPFIELMLIGIQKEVAERIIAKKGNSLSLFMQIYGDSSVFSRIKRGNFYPAPEVDAVWLLWRRNPQSDSPVELETLIRGAFWGKRKNIVNSFCKNPFFEKYEYAKKWPEKIKALPWLQETSYRADALELSDYIKILNEIKKIF